MARYIPFLTSDDGGNLALRVYSDAEFVRIPAHRAERLTPRFSHGKTGIHQWIDPSVDGFHSPENRVDEWSQFMDGFKGSSDIGSDAFHLKPDAAIVEKFVSKILNACQHYRPEWITVPQLPVCSGVERNEINLALAKATGKWRRSSSFRGKLIFPMVFTHQTQVNKKTDRNPKVGHAAKCYREAQADGLWVAETDLDDETGSPTLRNDRFPAVIQLHEELNNSLSPSVRIGGPYWALNMVLWSRKLIDYPAIGVGGGFQYYVSGGRANQPTTRIAIPSLKRRVTASSAVRKWLSQVLENLEAKHPLRTEFEKLVSSFSMLSANADRAKEQIAKVYKDWYDGVALHPAGGRSLALFQELSAAYAFGKSLPPYEDEKPRRPEAVAESFLLSCL